MSQLIDKLKRAADATPQPIGFHPVRETAPEPQMILIASLAHEKEPGLLTEYITGADAVLLPATKSTSSTSGARQTWA